MTPLQALILGIIQGITEFLPISSSGHLVLIPELFHWDMQPTSFDISIHIASLFAIIIYFRNDILDILNNTKEKRAQKLILNLLITTIPACIIGLLLKDFIDENFKNTKVIAFMLASIGIVMVFIDRILKDNTLEIKDLNSKSALVVGIAQVLAFIRGTSRSGITIISGLFMGLKREEAAKYSFLAGILIISASGLFQGYEFLSEGVKDIEISSLFIGFISAFISGLLSIRFLMNFIKKHGLQIFGIYRMILAIIIYALLL